MNKFKEEIAWLERVSKGDYFFHHELGNIYKGRTGAMRRHFAGWCAGELRKLGEAK